MAVPHNSPVHSPLDPVNQSYLLSGSPGFRKPATLPKPKRHRAPTFPGADPPNLTFFEGSKKSDWSTYSSDTELNPRWSEGQMSGSPKQDSYPPRTLPSHGNAQISKGISAETRYNMLSGPYISQDTVNFHTYVKQQQPHQPGKRDIHQRENQYLHYNKEHPPPNNRAHFSNRNHKPCFVRQTIVTPAIPNITWVERAGYPADTRPPGNINANGTFGYYPNTPSSVDSASLSPASTSAHAVRSLSPLIVTSAYTDSGAPSFHLLHTAGEPLKSRFTFNPNAEDFTPMLETDLTELTGADEYVGFYLSPEVKSPQTPQKPTTPSIYDCDPMAWQVPDNLKSPNSQSLESCEEGDCSCSSQHQSPAVNKSPEEFIGDIPNNMNWEKTFLPGSKKAHTKSLVGVYSGDITETPKTNPQEDVNAEVLNNNGDNKSARGNTQKAYSPKPTAEAEVAQTVASFFDHDTYNIVKFPNCSDTQPSQDPHEFAKNHTEQAADAPGSDGEPFGGDIQNCAEAGPKPKKAKPKVKAKAKPEYQLVKPETKPEIKVKPKTNSHAKAKAEKPIQKTAFESKTKPRTEGEEPLLSYEKERVQTEVKPPAEEYLSPFENTAELKTEDKPHPKELPSNLAPDILTSYTKPSKVFNYRDALLTNPETLIAPLLNTAHPNGFPQKVVVIPKVPKQFSPTRAEIISPPAQSGGRRKFFLSPLPTTATYDSVIRQLRGGMLEDIYISGLSPHPSAWKGPREKSNPCQNFPHDNTWHAHVSFYSEEGASKFWELVQSGGEYSGSYQSRYGGFDDQPPGFFYLDGIRVFVNWRHNDQRVVNSLTAKAVTEEKATRCLLLTFNIEAAMRSRIITLFKDSINTENSAGHAFVEKIAADIENWGQADSNLQGIQLLDEDALNPQTVAVSGTLAAGTTVQSSPKNVRILVSFIKLLTAVKMKKYLSGRHGYGHNGFCTVEYHKDECDEPIDTLQAIRETDDRVTDHQSKDVKETIPEPFVDHKTSLPQLQSMSGGGKLVVKVDTGRSAGTAVLVKTAEVDNEGFVIKGKGKIRGKNREKSHLA
ncbi:hypothetical protein Q9L58_005788 [Maublancomyces gigas]|uniref:Uncharacterized protein n=1 Tax=Discina gigas TaxID=1032678 RepID=A0ABR3GHB3_9PEZI